MLLETGRGHAGEWLSHGHLGEPDPRALDVLGVDDIAAPALSTRAPPSGSHR